MEDNWGEYWWLILMAGALGAFLAPFTGYFKRPRNGAGSATMHGAAIVDSSLLERVALALEAMLEIETARDRRKAAEIQHSEIETLRRAFEEQRREIEELKRGKR